MVTEDLTEDLVERARGGDAVAFSRLTEPFRRELQLHCYRMVGVIGDAEDLVQETLLSAWRAVAEFRGESSVRTWLYRIATNRCLNALRDRERRPVAAPPASYAVPPLEPSRLGQVTWLEPYPDTLLERVEGPVPPEARIEGRESVSLAFMAAVQTLPPRQRAVLVLRDVLGFRGAEVADMLDTTEDAVASGLKRARATLAARNREAPDSSPPLPGSSTEQRVVTAFVDAFERGDVPAMVSLLTDDAWLTMPPIPFEYQGPAAIADFFDRFGFRDGRSFRLLPCRANGQPAFGRYLRDPHVRVAHAHGLTVLTLRGDRLTELACFLGTDHLGRFGLPRTIPDDGGITPAAHLRAGPP